MSEIVCGTEQQSGADVDLTALINAVASTMVDNTVELDAAGRLLRSPSGFKGRKEIVTRQPALRPCELTERATPAQVREFYGDLDTGSPVTMWRDVDLLLSGDKHEAEERLATLRQRLDDYCDERRPGNRMPRITSHQPKGEAAWCDAAMLRAALPAFAHRIYGGVSSSETAQQVYGTLVREVVPYIQSAGRLAEVIVAALLARLHPHGLAYPTSMREERSRYRNENGGLFNHDLYQLHHSEKRKIPLQVKLYQYRSGPNCEYDPSIVQVFVLDWLAPALFGPTPTKKHPLANNPIAFLEYLRGALVIRTEGGEAMLDLAAWHLNDHIQSDSRRRQAGIMFQRAA